MFETKPVGRHSISVCTNISCMLRGGDDDPARTSRSGSASRPARARPTASSTSSVEEECLAACCGAPMMMVDHVYHENLTPKTVDDDSRRGEGLGAVAERQVQPRLLRDAEVRQRVVHARELPQDRRLRSRGRRCCAGELTRDTIIDEVKKSGMRGRGGAGFPTGVKMSFMPRTAPMQKYLVCNSGRERARHVPRPRHPALQPARARRRARARELRDRRARVAYNYIRGEFMAEPMPRFEAALKEAYAAGLLGKNIQRLRHRRGHPHLRRRRRVHLRRGDGAARVARRQAGQAALQAAVPRELRPVRRADHDQQHAEHRVDSDDPAQGRAVVRRSRRRKARAAPAIFSVSGHVEKPGNYELPLGIPFPELLEVAGGMRGGRKLKAVIPGGSSCPVVPAEKMMTLTMDFDTVKAAGSGLGTVRDDRHGRDHVHGQACCAASRASITPSRAASARRAAKAPAGCTAC